MRCSVSGGLIFDIQIIFNYIFNATFNNDSVISWLSVLLVEEPGVARENYWFDASHWQTFSYKSVSSIHLPWGAIKHKTLVVIGVDCIGEDTNPTTILSQPWWPIIKWSNVNHILPFTVIWVKLEDIFDSERCQLSDCVTVVYSLLHTMKERKKKKK